MHTEARGHCFVELSHYCPQNPGIFQLGRLQKEVAAEIVGVVDDDFVVAEVGPSGVKRHLENERS